MTSTSNEDLKRLLCTLLGYVGTDLDKTAASSALTTCVSYYLHGGHFPKGGAQRFAESLKEFIEGRGSKAGLSKNIIVKDVAMSKTLERCISMSEGAIYSFDQLTDMKRPYFKTPIKGLYLVGASTFPGGIEAVVISEIICVNDICNWKQI